jgi:sporulation protein YlmC with PRC-barrel domain
MQFRENTPVYTADGQEVGAIDRVVIDPETQAVTHVVIRQGWLFTEDKVAPVALIDQATADQVRLRADAGNLDDLPDFEETHYQPYTDAANTTPADNTTTAAALTNPVGGYARPLYAYPPVGVAMPGYDPMGDYAMAAYIASQYPVEIERNIPDGSIALKEGADVVDSNGKPVGRVARVFTDDETQQVTHLLVAEGWLFQEKRLVPTSWIREVADEEVQLKVDADFLRGLPEYRAQA